MASRGAGPGRCHAEGRQPLAGGVRGGARWKVCVSGQVQEASGGPCSHQRARWQGPGKDGQGNLSAQLVQAVTRAGGLWVRTWETCAVCHMLLQTTLHPPLSALLGCTLCSSPWHLGSCIPCILRPSYVSGREKTQLFVKTQ